MDGLVFALAAFVVISPSQAVANSISTDSLALYGLGVPLVAAGIWSGFRLLRKTDDEIFRRTVLWPLLFAGLSLIVATLALSFGPFMLDAFTSSAPPM